MVVQWLRTPVSGSGMYSDDGMTKCKNSKYKFKNNNNNYVTSSFDVGFSFQIRSREINYMNAIPLFVLVKYCYKHLHKVDTCRYARSATGQAMQSAT